MTGDRRGLRLLGLAVLWWSLSAVTPAAQTPPAPLIVAAVVADPSGETVTISGANFGSRPLVTLDLLPLTVRFASDSQIVAAVPVSKMPPGRYLLTVSRGPNPGDSASLPFVIDPPAAVSPAAATPAPPATATPVSPPGAAPAPASLSLGVGALPSGTDIAATIGSDVISVAEIDAAWERTDPASYLLAARLLYDNRRRAADRLVSDRLLAAEAERRGITVEALLAEEIPKRRIAMPDSAVGSIYRGLGERARGASLEQMRPSIRAWLAENTEPELAKMAFIEELVKVSTRADIRLAAPKVNIGSSESNASIGPPDAAVQLFAFGDFESDGYAAMAAVFPRLRDTFGDRVRLVFKHLPVLGPESVAIAEAAACVHAQGRFWRYHDVIVSQPGPFDARRLAAIAGEVGADRTKFDRCVSLGEMREQVREALEEAARYGVSESPSVMVNGRLAPPPPPFLPPFEFLKRLIEEELQRQATAR